MVIRNVIITSHRRAHIKAQIGLHGLRQRHDNVSKTPLRISEEVQQALAENRPVVALETAVYTHGFPYPDNIALASLLEGTVRANEAIPATIGILDGVARVGLNSEEISRLAGAAGAKSTMKVSRRDLAFVCGLGSPGRRYHGGTTVAGTAMLAHMAGIEIFATGGLGGVHRGAESSMDISADLTELGRTPVTVISSGCKSFLDIGRTLEYLETEGVPVGTFRDDRIGDIKFPGFWSRTSNFKSPWIIENEDEAASVIDLQRQYGLDTGILLANPIPEDLAIPQEEMDQFIEQAILEANKAGAKGNTNTPFILNRIKELTNGRSVEVNQGLLASNARKAALVAVALAKLRRNRNAQTTIEPANAAIRALRSMNFTPGVPIKAVSPDSTPSLTPASQKSELSLGTTSKIDVIVAGSIAVDLACDHVDPEGQVNSTVPLYTSNPARIQQSIGGVGHNITRTISLLDIPTRLYSVVGNDIAGNTIQATLTQNDMEISGIEIVSNQRTAQYVAVNASDKSLQLGMSDMAIINGKSGIGKSLSLEDIFENRWKPQISSSPPKIFVLDANWSSEMLSSWLQLARQCSALTVFEPVSTTKSMRLFESINVPALSVIYPNPLVHIASPNIFELTAMYQAAQRLDLFSNDAWWSVIDALGLPSSGSRKQLSLATSPALVDAGVPQQAIQLLPYMPCILTKLGEDGVLVTQIIPAGDARLESGIYSPYIISRCSNNSENEVGVGGLYMRLFAPADNVPVSDIVSVNGVGDTFIGTIIAGLAKSKATQGKNVEDLIDVAQKAAVLTLKSKESVSQDVYRLRGCL